MVRCRVCRKEKMEEGKLLLNPQLPNNCTRIAVLKKTEDLLLLKI
jgi:hypothetical protein